MNNIRKYKKVLQTKRGRKVLLRIPKKSDVEPLLEFINKLANEDTFISVRKRKTKKEEIEYLNKISQAVKEKKGITITAFHQNKVVGNGSVDKMGERREHIGLLGISISRDFRGEGLGKELMKELIRMAKEFLQVKLIELEVFGNNPRAIHLYQKFGFKECGRVPGAIHYKNKFADNVIMYLKLR